MAEFRMPALGADMDEGTLLEWLVKPGSEVHKGDIIAVVDTAKSAIEVESFHTGVVERLLAEPGTTVPVGTVLAVIKPTAPAGPAQQPPAVVAEQPRAVVAEQAPPKRAVAPGATPLIRREARELGVDLATVRGTGRNGAITRADVEAAAGRNGAAAPSRAVPPRPAAAERLAPAREPAPAKARPQAAPAKAGPEAAPAKARPQAAPAKWRATPLARRLAAELDVDLSTVTGTGPNGVVKEDDVRAAAQAGKAAPQPSGAAVPAGSRAREAKAAPPARATPSAERALAMRQAIAKLMARSKREIPHYYLTNPVDLGAALAWLHDRNAGLEVSARLVPAALLLKAAALAARKVPQLNGFWQEDRFVPAPSVHLGVAISLRGGGLITPAIHDADALSACDLMLRLRDLVNRGRAGRLRSSELTDATITVTNLGDQGVESVTGVIYPPQVALVGFGKITERPWAVGGLLGIRPVVVTTLAGDHRATDGYAGARFLATVADLLQRPEEL